jgi:hypothetical protein
LGLVLLSCGAAQAVTFEVQDQTGNVIFSETHDADLSKSAGLFTVDAFNEAQNLHKLTFKGDEDGLVSVNSLANDTKVISQTEIKAYGWCFSINGVVPSTMSNETFFLSNSDTLTWFYGYAHYLNGNWVNMCVPAWR